MNKNKQGGFTLVEIAIVLVIIGLLLGGILKGQELINSARVRNLADMNSGVQAAYYGFIDRYRQVPGDWDAGDAETAIGVDIGLGGDGNGRIDSDLKEAAAVWEQLSKAGFIQGSYNADASQTSAPAAGDYRNYAPRNAFNGSLVMTRNDGYVVDTGAASVRLNLHLGTLIPVNISRELDVKVDDGRPETGVLRLSATSADGNFDEFFDTDNAPSCIDDGNYNISGDAQDCGVAFLY